MRSPDDGQKRAPNSDSENLFCGHGKIRDLRPQPERIQQQLHAITVAHDKPGMKLPSLS